MPITDEAELEDVIRRAFWLTGALLLDALFSGQEEEW